MLSPLPAPLEFGRLSSLPFNGELWVDRTGVPTLSLLALALSTFLSLNLSCSRLGPEVPLTDGFRGRFTDELLLLELGVILVRLDALDSGRGGKWRTLRVGRWLSSMLFLSLWRMWDWRIVCNCIV